MSDRDRKTMRGLLAGIGIFLDDINPRVEFVTPVADPVPVDRNEIRALLMVLGAPTRHLDWLTASCPSVEHALTYKPSDTP